MGGLLGRWITGKDAAQKIRDLYTLSALWIEFLRDSKQYRERFDEFVRRAGNAEIASRYAIEEVSKQVYGCGLAALDAAFVEWCRER